MGEPTNLPNFNKLTSDIARGSGKIFDSSKDTPERFLGELEQQNIPVQKLASNRLDEHTLQPNRYHKNIVELFSKNNIKIVTTNYDLMFEEICKELDIKTDIYSNPAFPRGNNFSGIVHLHGRVGDFENMILTDSDFGKAYMVYGEASTFLSQLFNSDYTVLFIGYSYNDTVLRYFTRALPDLSGEKRYIFSNEFEKTSHEFLGLTPIIYESENYENLYNTIQEIGAFTNRDSLSWYERITEVSLASPSEIDLTTRGEIEHIFSEKYLLEQFLNQIDSTDWFYYLYENNYLNFIFNEKNFWQSEQLIMNWIFDKFVNNDCKEIISILLEHNNEINVYFKNMLLRAISYKPVNIKALQRILNLVNFDGLEDHTMYSLIKKLSNYDIFNKVITDLFQEILKFEYSFTPSYLESENKKYEVRVSVKNSLIEQIWKLISEKDIHLESLAETITNELIDLENKSIIGDVEQNFSFARSFLDDNEYTDDKTSYIRFFISLLIKISDTNVSYVEGWIHGNINSNLSILRRISVYLISHLGNVTAEDRLCFIDEKVGIFCFHEKEEIFSVIKTEFPKLTIEQQNTFVKYIMNYTFKNENNIEEQRFERSSNYDKFNILVWLKKTGVKNEEILHSIAKIKELHPEFEERDYPDRNIGPIISGFANQNIQTTPNDFLDNDVDDYFNDLLEYDGDGFEKPDRYAILRIASEAIGEEFNLGLEYSAKLLNMENYDSDLWGCIFQGFEKHVINSDKFIQIYDTLSPKIIKRHTREVARVLLKYSDSITVDEYYECIIEIYSLLDTLLKYSSSYKGSASINWVNKVLNSSYGLVTEAVVNFVIMLNRSRNKSDYHIDKEIRKYVDDIIDNTEAGEAHTVLYMNLENFNMLDSQWTNDNLIPNFNSEDDDKFNISWQGYLSNSSFNRETCKKFSDAFLFAIKNINRLSEEDFKRKFINVYALMCTDVIDDPLLEYIPYLYSYSEELIEDFYNHLVYTLKSREGENKKSIWEKWLKNYIQNRINNIPTSYNTEETYWILLILLEYGFLFDNVKNIIDSMKKEIKSPIGLFYELEERNINEENNDTVQLILTFCLGSIYEDEEDMIDDFTRDIVEKILSNILNKNHELTEELVEICASLNIGIHH